jgi:hypothetical protein
MDIHEQIKIQQQQQQQFVYLALEVNRVAHELAKLGQMIVGLG